MAAVVIKKGNFRNITFELSVEGPYGSCTYWLDVNSPAAKLYLKFQKKLGPSVGVLCNYETFIIKSCKDYSYYNFDLEKTGNPCKGHTEFTDERLWLMSMQII